MGALRCLIIRYYPFLWSLKLPGMAWALSWGAGKELRSYLRWSTITELSFLASATGLTRTSEIWSKTTRVSPRHAFGRCWRKSVSKNFRKVPLTCRLSCLSTRDALNVRSYRLVLTMILLTRSLTMLLRSWALISSKRLSLPLNALICSIWSRVRAITCSASRHPGYSSKMMAIILILFKAWQGRAWMIMSLLTTLSVSTELYIRRIRALRSRACLTLRLTRSSGMNSSPRKILCMIRHRTLSVDAGVPLVRRPILCLLNRVTSLGKAKVMVVHLLTISYANKSMNVASWSSNPSQSVKVLLV